MLAATISQYLRYNRRLVIPQLGAFLIKEPNHSIVFSTLLTRDDGILRELLIEQGVSIVEASGIIDRLIFDVRFAIENNECFSLEGVGSFSANTTGNIHFEAYVAPIQEEVAIESQEAVEPQAYEHEVATESIEVPIKEVEATEKPADRPTDKITPEAPSTPKPTFSILEQDSDFKGLSYGASSKYKRKPNSRRSKKSVDWWLIIGICAIALAAIVIIYGFVREGADSSAQQMLW